MTIEEKASQIQKEMHQTINWCESLRKNRSIKTETPPEYQDYVNTFLIQKIAELELRIDHLVSQTSSIR